MPDCLIAQRLGWMGWLVGSPAVSGGVKGRVVSKRHAGAALGSAPLGWVGLGGAGWLVGCFPPLFLLC